MDNLYTKESLKKDVELVQNIPVVPALLDIICRTTNMRFAAVARVTGERWITCSAHDEINFGLKPGDELKVETTICHEIRQSHQTVIIDHVTEDKQFCNHPTPAMYGFESYISVPVFKKDGSFFGTLCAIDPKPNKLNTIEIKGMFTQFADLIAFHMQAIEQLEEGKLAVLRERDEKAKLLEQKNEELTAMNAELESFTYIASHDLQEPLRKIKTFSDKLLETEFETLSANGKFSFERLVASVNRMQHLIEDLLGYTRLSVHDRTLLHTDLKVIAEEIKQDYQDNLKTIPTINIGDMCMANVIPFQAHQLFQNLISNSIKFARHDVAGIIEISSTIEKGDTAINQNLSPLKNYCHITIADNGIGFEPQYSTQIFKIFQRLHGKHDYEGTGIGLAIVKKIVDNHRGVIIAIGKINEGATFHIYFPQE